MGRTLVALYDSPQVVGQVLQALRDKGFADDEVRAVQPSDFLERPPADTDVLGISGAAKPDIGVYEEAVRRGHGLVAVTAEERHLATGEEVLEEFGAVDIDLLSKQWQTEGWNNPHTDLSPSTDDEDEGPPRSGGTVQMGRTRGSGVRVFVW